MTTIYEEARLESKRRRMLSDREIYNAQILAACDALHKWEYVNGVIPLYEYLLRETRHTKRLNGIAKMMDK